MKDRQRRRRALLVSALGLVAAGGPGGRVPAQPAEEAELRAWRRVLDHDPGDLAARGVVPWAVLTDMEVGSGSMGPLRTVFTSRFSAAAEALDGASVRLMGFFFPIEAAVRHERFLLTAWPPSCPYCLPAGPTHMVEVLAAEPVRAGDEPILVEGRFELLRDDPSGLYYRLREARAVAG